MKFLKLLPAVFCVALLAAASDDVAPGPLLDGALAEAKARHVPVIVDFYAPWCHSCFFMDQHVLNGAEWEQVKTRARVLSLDADSPEGGRWSKEWKVGGFPSYIVLDENGHELGRILGDRDRASFYKALGPLLEQGSGLDGWKAKVVDGGPGSVAAARMVLDAYQQREDYEGGLAWVAALPAPARAAVERDRLAGRFADELALGQASAANDTAACAASAAKALRGPLDCDTVGDVDTLNNCGSKLPAEQQHTLLSPYRAKMHALVETVYAHKMVCSDTRGVFGTAADYYEALGDDKARHAALVMGERHAEQGLKGDYTADHHLADNLRFYLENDHDNAALDVLYPKLIAAYPDIYDYWYRYGKNLARRGEYAKALPYLEHAAQISYGRNRLWVAQWRAQALIKLGRGDDARQAVADAIQANGPFFPEDIAMTKGVLEGKEPR
jgi:thiol-disulfide isomerase/thioredoxin